MFKEIKPFIPMKFKGYLLACLSATSYGMIPLFAIPLKQENISFDAVLFYRFFFTSVMIGLYLISKKVNLRINLKELISLIALGGVFALSSFFLFWGYDFMPAGVASTILFMYPVFVALLMGILFKEKISWVMWLAIIMALAGVAILNNSDGKVSIDTVGVIIVIISALSYALYLILVNKSSVKNMSATKLTFYSMGFCSLFFLVKSVGQGTFQPIPSFYVGGEIVLFALITTVISCITMVYAVHYIGSTPTAIMGALEPVVAVFISVILFHEALTSSLAFGILVIITAVMLTVLSSSITKSTDHLRRFIRKGHYKAK